MSADPVSFSKAVLDLMWESADDIDNESIEALAVEHGLILWRKPTPARFWPPIRAWTARAGGRHGCCCGCWIRTGQSA